ncbi:MAG: hypothetical protein RL641_717, partial [Candidatus Parcubacteria bacterium]
MQKSKNSRFTVNRSKIIKEVKSKKDAFWGKLQESNSLALFHETVERVPAYRNFLKENNFNPGSIKTWNDFKNIPIMSKQNYLKQYQLPELVKDGSLHSPFLFTSTSGSTGEPYYFPRSEKIDAEYSLLAELYGMQGKFGFTEPTLVLVCFGMGVWIGGLITYQAFEMMSRENNYPI